ncbi:MAG TPA: translation initiation factor IF-2 [Flavipsychrobacter sp.]|nr:translation initiation factor IF-2 [Flavipsychrobacter sp.]
MAIVNKTPRLLAAAKEFNIGKDTLVEFLTGKGFDINASNPNTKITEEMYDALAGEFAQDKAAKRKSEAIDLPRGGSVQDLRLKEEPKKEEIKKEEPKKEEPKKEEPKKEIPVVEAPPVKEEPPVVEVKEEPQPEPAPPVQEKPKVEAPIETDEGAPEDENSHIEVKSPKLEGPKILNKINLDEMNLSTRPKKGAAKKTTTKKEEKIAETPEEEKVTANKEEKIEEEVKEVPKSDPKPEMPSPPSAPAPEIPEAKPEEEKKEHIEMKAPKLEGPKILGKIELPVSSPSRNDSREKRNRKRIPVAKKPESFKPGQTQPGQGLGDRRTGPGGPHPGSGQRDFRPGGQGGSGDRRGGFDRNRPGGGDRRGVPQTPQQQEIDQKAIQDKIRQTQAKLAGGGGGRNKNQKSKYRRTKREEMAEKRAAEESGLGDRKIQVTEFISVSELASLLDVSFADVISKCMGLGIMVSINQRLDAEVIELVAEEFGYEVEFINLEQEADSEDEDDVDDVEDLEPRAPIVTIMGHVDHGKTSLLDYIRSANVVAGEAGGITQHIGAYQVTTADNKKITFLDTPGHEAFTAMRARGAKAADIAVIVIAADDAIMPQTKEAISHAQAAQLPMIFAINKIDKEGSNPEKIKEQLAQQNILVEDWGGKFQSQEISAKKGLHVDQLLEKILLEAELLDLKANPDRGAVGSVIEASLDKGRGFQATILIQNGTLQQGDMVVCGQYYGKVKAMFNERSQRVTKAGPSAPVQILGLNGAPQAGEKLKVFEDENEAKQVATHRSQILREQGIRTRKHITLDEIGRRLALGNFKELSVIIKGDFDGSVEALSDSLQKLSTEEVAVNVVHKGVGQITESDVLLATASDAIIIGFQVRPSSQAGKLAENENIEIRTYSIIYDAIEEIKSAMEGLLEPKVERKTVANVEVREVYKISGVGTIAGCYVLDGKIARNSKINLVRDGIVVYNGELASLKRFKDDMKEVAAGYECGMSVKNYNDVREGDIIEAYEEVAVKRTL